MQSEGKNKNVLGGTLIPCSMEPLTGFYRNGKCQVELTSDFLAYSKQCGNDLSTPIPQYGFPGLKAGDRWCVCAERWTQAHAAGHACPVILEATSEAALKYVSRSVLEEFAIEAKS